ncbi:MAG TPA: hypothetical protein PK990_05190 [Salinivirgaceae bacterium]|nr:hypothetical protein [Salinivirgaceae bacterium]
MADLKPADCFPAGKITRTHGLNGAVVFKTVHNLETLDFDEPVFVQIDGLPVPLFLEEFIEHSNESYIIKFELLDSIDEAKRFVGCDVLLPKKILENDEFGLLFSLRNLDVYDLQVGYLGKCVGFEPIPGNPLLLIEDQGKQRFIPFADEIIVEIVPHTKVVIQCPPGLLDI